MKQVLDHTGLLLMLFVIACVPEPHSPPRASFRISKSQPEINETLKFTSQSAGATSYLWNFGDGYTSDLQNPSHYYSLEGEYRVELYVENSLGSDDTSHLIQVSRPEILWPSPGTYSGHTEAGGSIRMSLSDKHIDTFKGSFFVSIAGEIYELNSSFGFGDISRNDSGFVARYNGNMLFGIYHNDSISGVWHHNYGSEKYRIVKE
ncbi:MAG: PKD domain-containing protein [Bacteroidales bacterium]|nr:PKD domain-containing protein [Bacteroidales bacterium]